MQNYSRLRFGPDGTLPRTENLTGAGLELVPTSLAATCRQTHELTRLPVLITEHRADLDDSQDDRRGAFIEESRANSHRRSPTASTSVAICNGA